MNIEKQFIIQGNKLNFETGIRYLKTVVTTNYDELSEDFKHKDVKDAWDSIEGIPVKLYQMTQSKDKETLDLACELLTKANIHHSFRQNYYGPNTIELWNN